MLCVSKPLLCLALQCLCRSRRGRAIPLLFDALLIRGITLLCECSSNRCLSIASLRGALPMQGLSIPSQAKAYLRRAIGAHLRSIQCHCFTQQILRPWLLFQSAAAWSEALAVQIHAVRNRCTGMPSSATAGLCLALLCPALAKPRSAFALRIKSVRNKALPLHINANPLHCYSKQILCLETPCFAKADQSGARRSQSDAYPDCSLPVPNIDSPCIANAQLLFVFPLRINSTQCQRYAGRTTPQLSLSKLCRALAPCCAW